MLFEKPGDDNRCETFQKEIFRALIIYICSLVDALISKTRKVAIDAAFITDTVAVDLYPLLSELGRTIVPLAYLFDEKDTMAVTGSAGKISQILEQLLRTLQQ